MQGLGERRVNICQLGIWIVRANLTDQVALWDFCGGVGGRLAFGLSANQCSGPAGLTLCSCEVFALRTRRGTYESGEFSNRTAAQHLQSAIFQRQSNDSMPTGAAKHRFLEGCRDWPNRFSEMCVNKHCSGETGNVKV